MMGFARTAEAVASRSGKLEKIAIIAEYLHSLDDKDLAAAARFFTGSAFAACDQRTLALGGRALANAVERVWAIPRSDMQLAYRETGDFGAAVGLALRRLVGNGTLKDLHATIAVEHPGLFDTLDTMTERLTPASLEMFFDAIAAISGKNANKQRETLCKRILSACDDPLEVTYVLKIMTGDLRIGLKEGLVLDAIAKAFEANAARIRRALMANGDIGHVAVAAKNGMLENVHVSYGSPIGFMLASAIPFGQEYKDLARASWIAEDKYDGIRAQAHIFLDDAGKRRVQLFSRKLNDVTHSYPEIASALRKFESSVILDGEIAAKREGQVLPFRYLQARLQRKEISADLLKDIPLVYVVFDVLTIGDDFLIDETLLTRRERLSALFEQDRHIEIAPFERIPGDAQPPDINALFEAARKRGNEGLMLKRIDAPYLPGRRGKWWLKLKRELSTLDVVVVAVEWGHGRRAKVLSDYTFAVRKDSSAVTNASGDLRREDLVTIGKAYSGLTDKEIAELTQWFLTHQTGGTHRHAMEVEPKIVLEVAFDVIQKSNLHESGYSLRFPRIVRIRDDKPSNEIDTLARVDQIYNEMLSRERV